MGKASLPKTPINDTLDANKERKKQFGRERSSFSGISSITTSIGSGVNSTGNTEQQVIGLSTGGGTMTGPIAFHPKTGTISNGTINLEQTEAYSSRIIVSGQGSISDDLEVILNASHAGQILFFQPVTVGHTITLQDFAKTATAWATGTSYSIGDVRLSNSRRYTCYVAHTSSASTQPTTGSDWSDKWHRNNIHIPGATEKVVQANEIILLQYDQSSNITWTLVSGGGSGGAGLGDANVWTNVNTFQSTVNFNGPAVNLGDATSDRVNFIAKLGTDIDLNTYDVKNMDRLKFSTTAGSGSALGTSDTGIEAQYSGGSSAGIKFQVPTSNIYQFFSGSTEKVNIGASTILLNSPVSVTGALAMGTNKITGLGTPTATTDAATKAYVDSAGGGWTGTATSDLNMSGNDIYDSTGDVKFNDDLDMQGNDIQDVDQFDFQVTGQRFNSTSSAIQYEVPSGDSHKFIVSSNIKATLDSSSLTLASTCDLVLTYGSVIDFSAASTTSKTGGSAASLPSNPVGYILVKFSGNNRYIPYYS